MIPVLYPKVLHTFSVQLFIDPSSIQQVATCSSLIGSEAELVWSELEQVSLTCLSHACGHRQVNTYVVF